MKESKREILKRMAKNCKLISEEFLEGMARQLRGLPVRLDENQKEPVKIIANREMWNKLIRDLDHD